MAARGDAKSPFVVEMGKVDPSQGSERKRLPKVSGQEIQALRGPWQVVEQGEQEGLDQNRRKVEAEAFQTKQGSEYEQEEAQKEHPEEELLVDAGTKGKDKIDVHRKAGVCSS